MDADIRQLLGRIEVYLDAAPRSATSPEQVGKFTLFRPLGPWPYYARPTLGLHEDITVDDVHRLQARQRELSLPLSIEWIYETTPSLEASAAAVRSSIAKYPLLIHDGSADVASTPPYGTWIRRVSATDIDFAQAHAVANVGFAAEGTAVGAQGARERDERAAQMKPGVLDFMRERARKEYSVSYAAFDGSGPIAVGTHQPVDDATEIVGVATLPAARRRGIAAALTSALVADAQRRGLQTIFLSAGSDDVARVYERVGFRRVGFAGSAEAAS